MCDTPAPTQQGQVGYIGDECEMSEPRSRELPRLVPGLVCLSCSCSSVNGKMVLRQQLIAMQRCMVASNWTAGTPRKAAGQPTAAHCSQKSGSAFMASWTGSTLLLPLNMRFHDQHFSIFSYRI